MKILFVSSTTNNGDLPPIIENQGNSLVQLGVKVDYFTIKRKAYKGYLQAVSSLKNTIKHNSYEIIHAHYGLSAIVATLAGAKPLVVSLMGSDVKERGLQLLLIKILCRAIWKVTIVKSQEMAGIVGKRYTKVIPNGVNLYFFFPVKKEVAKNYINWSFEKRYLLFGSNPQRPEKNFTLIKQIVDKMNNGTLELVCLHKVPSEKIKYYLNGAEVLLVSSFWEGSPNIIKEAMACNVPVVSTRVGDVEWLLSGVDGCYLANFDNMDYAEKVNMALSFAQTKKKTNGRARIMELTLDSESIAREIIGVYKSVYKQ